MQQFTIYFFGFFQNTAHHICSQVHWFALSPMFLYHFHSLTATVPTGLTAVSAHNIWCGFVDIRLITHCNTGLKTPSHAQCSNLQLIFLGFSELQLIPSAARCTDLHWVHVSVSFPQCHWSSRCRCMQHLVRCRPIHSLLCACVVQCF